MLLYGTSLFITGWENTIRKLEFSEDSFEVRTIPGSVEAYSGSLNGSGKESLFNKPNAILYDDSSLYAVDSANNSIRVINPQV